MNYCKFGSTLSLRIQDGDVSVSLPHWDVRSSRPSTVAPGEPGRDGSVPKGRSGCTGSFKGTFAEGGGNIESSGLQNWGGQTQMLVGPVVLIDVFLILSNPLVSTLTRPAQRGLFDPVLTAPTRSEHRFSRSHRRVLLVPADSFPPAGPCKLLVLVKNALVACGLLKWSDKCTV
ncbi:hypothetical protein fugu_006944 [Takifugu bimaculatus]|uniref:Uncharacterized protein n=1 Tax=Takifugu bimaculatus TaxID=433685 RepID=A0A4Z2B2V7_9TELE|nr:hypothetical protein fugu_006944 [Takifugu bimaculatus]